MARIEKTELIETAGKNGTTYGGRVIAADGRVVTFWDIHPDPARAAAFLRLITGEEVDETQLWYYLEDFLAEE